MVSRSKGLMKDEFLMLLIKQVQKTIYDSTKETENLLNSQTMSLSCSWIMSYDIDCLATMEGHLLDYNLFIYRHCVCALMS